MESMITLISMVSTYGLSVILGLVVAPLIYADAKRIPVLFLNTQPWFWAACAILLGALWTVLVYWAIHYSSISNRAIEPSNND